MKIFPGMDLNMLAERMGNATREEAVCMRDLLNNEYLNEDTQEIPDLAWDIRLELATEKRASQK